MMLPDSELPPSDAPADAPSDSQVPTDSSAPQIPAENPEGISAEHHAESAADDLGLPEARALGDRLRAAVGKAVIGMERELDHCLAAVLAGGHVLVEGPPGVAKTLLVRSLATALGGSFGRVQFTPDLMPADVTGTSIFRPSEGRFEFQPGPLFASFLLCDEINRAPAKTQAALLECMQEGQVTVDGVSHPLPPLFTVFATQNPVENEGTYPLPEAQLDRFLFKVETQYPSEEVEQVLLATAHKRVPGATPDELGVEPVCSIEELEEMRAKVRAVRVEPELTNYAVRLLRATRVDPAFFLGASPRAGVMLLQGAKAFAALAGRDFLTPDDIKDAFLPTMRHRVILDPAEELQGGSVGELLERLLDSEEVPR